MSAENIRFSTPHDAYAESHIGGRERNEDYAALVGNLFVVADGIGQLFGSDVAAREGVRTFIDTYHKLSAQADTRGKTGTNLYKAVQAANRHMVELARQYKAKQMGAAFTGALLEPKTGRLHIVHLGDTRLYLLRAGQIIRLTRDHTAAEDLFEKGKIKSVDEAEPNKRSGLSRALSGQPQDVPEMHHTYLRRGDRILLCSDGLHGVLNDLKIREILDQADAAKGAAKMLVQVAHAEGTRRFRGKHDNITALVYFHKH